LFKVIKLSALFWYEFHATQLTFKTCRLWYGCSLLFTGHEVYLQGWLAGYFRNFEKDLAISGISTKLVAMRRVFPCFNSLLSIEKTLIFYLYLVSLVLLFRFLCCSILIVLLRINDGVQGEILI